MTLHVKQGGTWREITEAFVKQGGTWQPLERLSVRVAGTWEDVFVPPAELDDLDGGSISAINSDAGVRLTSAGSCDALTGNPSSTYAQVGDDWYTGSGSPTGASYECRLTVNSGDTPAGSSTATWLALSSQRSWEVSPDESGNYTLEIRSASSGTVLASATFTMAAATV